MTCARNAPESRLPHGASFVEADITDENSVSALIDAAIDRHGHLDVVVANAGGANIGPWPDEPFDQWQEPEQRAGYPAVAVYGQEKGKHEASNLAPLVVVPDRDFPGRQGDEQLAAAAVGWEREWVWWACLSS